MNDTKISFINGPRVEINGDKSASYQVDFIDFDSGLSIYSTTISTNHWASANLKYYINWRILISEDGKQIVNHRFNIHAKDKKVYIRSNSSALGDTLAWIPYFAEFQRIHECEVVVATHWNQLFELCYPNLKFQDITTVLDEPQYAAAYYVGAFDNDYTKNKNNWRFIPLQQVASDFLGLEFKEIRPQILRSTKLSPLPEKYVTISEFSTFQGKFWNRLNGWQELVNWLVSQGLKVMSVSREETQLKNVIKNNNRPIEETIRNIQHSEFFIGVGSGLAWLAWALNIKPVIISGFSEPYSEMSDCVRIINKEVCHGCYNDQHVQFDRGNWRWCPRNNNFECSTKISVDMVTKAIGDRLLSKSTTPAAFIGDDRFRFRDLIVNTRSDYDRRQQDMNVVNTVLVGDEYGLEKLKAQGLNPITIVDVGGHIGCFGLKAKSLWPDARLIAYEPNKESAELYKRNMIDNGFLNWTIFDLAISYDEARTYLVEDRAATGGGILVKPSEITEEGKFNSIGRVHSKSHYDVTYTDVRSCTLDLALDGIESVDLLKLDCEGAEIEILQCMEPETAAKIKYVVGEYHYIPGYEGFAELFKSKFPDHTIEPIKQLQDDLHMNLGHVGEFTARPSLLLVPKSVPQLAGKLSDVLHADAPRVLMLMYHCSTGGMPQYTLRCVEQLYAAGRQVEVVEFSYAGGYEVQRKQFQKIVPFHSLNGNKQQHLKDIIDKFHPDIIHIQEFPEHWAHTPDAVEAMKELYRPGHPYRIIETSHGADVLEPEQKTYFPDAFAWVSKYHAQKFSSLNIPYSIVQYQATPHTRPDRTLALAELNLDPTYKHILNVGLFTPGKNQGEVFEIARRLPKIQFHFVGNCAPNFASYWEPLLAQKPENCHLWGEKDDVDPFYASMDLLLFTSKAELNPLVIKEALAWKMPILMRNLATYCGEYDNNPFITFINDDVDRTCILLGGRVGSSMLQDLESAYTWGVDNIMPLLENSGTQTAVINTEHTLHSDVDDKTYVLLIDTNAMQAGDTIELRVYTILTGGVSRVVYYDLFSGEQAATDKIKISIPLTSDIGCAFTLKQTVGVGRAFPWKVLSI